MNTDVRYRAWCLTMLGAFTVLGVGQEAHSALFLVAQEQGRITLSVDGVGTRRMRPAPIEVEKPSDEATVRAAYYACAAVSNDPVTAGNVSLVGNPIVWDIEVQRDGFTNVLADITALVAADIDARPAGRFALLHQERDPS
ncbi:MAG: hypothetical protein AAFX85_19085 [Pseudomonadota bacterium]